MDSPAMPAWNELPADQTTDAWWRPSEGVAIPRHTYEAIRKALMSEAAPAPHGSAE